MKTDTKPNQVPMRECVTHSFACDCRERLFLETADKLAKAEEEIERMKGLGSGWDDSVAAYRYKQIDEAVSKMGGWANFRVWTIRHAKEYFETCDNLEAKLAASQAREAVLLDALKFYRDVQNYSIYNDDRYMLNQWCEVFTENANLAIAKHAEMKGDG